LTRFFDWLLASHQISYYYKVKHTNNLTPSIIVEMISPRYVLLSALLVLSTAAETAFVMEDTGSVTISCPDADDTCKANGSLSAISGTFNIGTGNVLTSMDGGVTSIFTEGTGINGADGAGGQATTITCTDGCTCALVTDGSDCDTEAAPAPTPAPAGTGSAAAAAVSIAKIAVPLMVGVGVMI
jgi:hypothetical protein